MHKKIQILCIFILVFSITRAQNNDFKGSRIILANNSGGAESKFFIYNPVFKAKAIYTDLSQVTNEYPEQLLSSTLSASAQEWANFNILQTSGLQEKMDQKHFESVKSMDREKTYMELICKFQFQYEGSDMAIIKFLFHIEEKDSVCGAYVMQKINGRWYKTATPFTNDLSVMIIRMKADKLEQILTEKPDKDSYIVDLLNKIKEPNGSISILKLVNEFKSWYTNNHQDKIAHFKDPKSW